MRIHPRRSPPPRLGPRILAARRADRTTLRLPVPGHIVALVSFGLDHPETLRPAFWDRVGDGLASFIEGQLPAGAEGVRMHLDEGRTEVVVSFRPARDADAR